MEIGGACRRILPRLRGADAQDRVGVEVLVVGKRDFLPVRVEQPEHRLEESGNRIADEGEQPPTVERHRIGTVFFEPELEAIGFARHDLPVQDGGNDRDRRRRRFRLVRRGEFRFGDVAGRVDEEQLRAAHPAVSPEPEFPGSRFRSRRDIDIDD